MSGQGREFVVARRKPPHVGSFYIAGRHGIHQHEVIDRCRVPTPEGPCGHPRYETESVESFERGHVIPCLRANHDTIMAERARQHPAIMDAWDPELEKWITKHGAAILEGRKRV